MLGEERIFEVAVPRKPYYNPANLEKVGGGVKQKEFIGRISGARKLATAAYQRSGPPRGDFFFRVARVGSARAGDSATYTKPLPALWRIRCAAAAARDFSSASPRP